MNYEVQPICLRFVILFAVSSILFIYKQRRKNIICFETIFFIAFFLTTLVYPTFFNDEIPISFFDYGNSTFNIIKSTSIAMIGFFCYIIGATLVSIKTNNYHFKISRDKYYPTEISFLVNSLISLLFIFFILSGGLDAYDSYAGGKKLSETSDIFLFYIRNLLIVSSILEFLRLKNHKMNKIGQFIKKVNKFYLTNYLVIVMWFLISGDRGELLKQILSFLLLYWLFVTKINTRNLLIIFITGFVLMSTIKNIRLQEGGLLNFSNFSDAFIFSSLEFTAEFSSSSATLYYLVQSTDYHGYSMGTNYLFPVLSVIPMLQSLFAYLFNINPSAAIFERTAVVATEGLLGPNPYTGLGTHIIGDLYYSFGSVGVIFFMFLIGYFISFLNKKIFYESSISITYLFIYVFLFAGSFYFIRTEYFSYVRDIGFSLLFIYSIHALHQFKTKINMSKVFSDGYYNTK